MDEARLIELLRAELAPIKAELAALARLPAYSYVKTRRNPVEPEPFPNAAKPANRDAKTLYCSFCGKSNAEVSRLIAGPGNLICNECVDLCASILRGEAEGKVAEDAP